MSFYKIIAENYKYIFPFKPQQLDFVKSFNKNNSSLKILDIGCARGEFSFELSKYFEQVFAIDLDSEMIKMAKAEYEKNNLHFYEMNMLDIDNEFNNNFNACISFGNTIVHLVSEKQIQQLFNKIKKVLDPGSFFMFQIVNYDRVIANKIKELPTIENDKIRFERYYSYENNLVNFETNLFVKNEQKHITSSIKLFPLSSTLAIKLLKNTGFSNINLYGSFKKEKFSHESFPMIVSCVS